MDQLIAIRRLYQSERLNIGKTAYINQKCGLSKEGQNF